MSRSVVRFAMAVRCALTLCATLTSALAVACPLGTFRWQMLPYCNVVTVSVTESGGVYTLDGHDDQCGADTHAPATGTAVLNPDVADGSSPVRYGVIAEEVERVLPELVAYGANGEPETVMHHILPTMRLAEVQRPERERVGLIRRMEAQERAQAERIGALERSFGELREPRGAGERGSQSERR